MDERLDGRGGKIWRAYVGGRTQDQIAVEHGVSQQRVSQIIAEVREGIADTDRADAALLAVERANALISAVWPAALAGDVKAVGVALRVMERTARALGLDVQEPLTVVLQRRRDMEGEIIAEALAGALDVLGLTDEQRAAAYGAAQARLLGEDPPAPPVSVSPPVVPDPRQARLEADFRKFAAENGFDPDEDDDEGGDDD